MVEYIVQTMWLVWILISLLSLILELTSGDFFVICFAIGGIGAALFSLFIDSLTAQIIIFAVLSVFSIIFIRPLALKYFHKNEDKRLSNADALIGRMGKITEAIEPNGYGRVQIDGDYWKAKSHDGSPIELGKEVRIKTLDSTIVTVEPC